MKSFILYFALAMIVMTGCKKDEITQADPPLQNMQTGVYTGKYIEKDGVTTTNYQFRVNVAQVNDTVYTIQQLDAGNLPTFEMVKGTTISTGERTKIKFRIFRQDVAGSNLVGDARITNGYDAIWNALERSFTFGIVFDNDPQNYIRFTGIKE